MRTIKLALVGALATGVVLLSLYWFDRPVVVGAYRCLKYAEPWYACFGNRPVDFTADFYGMKFKGNTANVVDGMVLYAGAFERSLLHFLRDVVEANFPGSCVFVDVGAHVGQHSLFMSKLVREVHAFEPYEPVLERFRYLVNINGIRNIVIHPVGLGARNETLQFYQPPDFNTGMGSFLQGFGSWNTPHHELRVVVGDEILRDLQVFSVDVVKIDVEGFERNVLKGLSETMARYRPIVVLELSIRLGANQAFQSARDLLEAFPHDYELLAFRGNLALHSGTYELVDIQSVNFSRDAQYEVVAYPSERGAGIPRSNAMKTS